MKKTDDDGALEILLDARLVRRLLAAVAAVVCLATPLWLYATFAGIPNVFVNGEVADPDEMNVNFMSIAGAIDRIGFDCPLDMVLVGPGLCVDRYEASVWGPPGTPLEETQYGLGSLDYPCAADGQDCGNIFARSREGVVPSRAITWFQAQQACANAGKRLLTNAEWQMAVVGTRDPGDADNGTTDCNTLGVEPVPTGERAGCQSSVGVNDMVGNLFEWVADWKPYAATPCPGWGSFSDDLMCMAGTVAERSPGALLRGGSFGFSTGAGPFTISARGDPLALDSSRVFTGFRCARRAS